MQPFPPCPDVADVADDHLRGNLWVLEHVCGEPMRFRVEPSGLVVTGDADRRFDHGDEPLPYRAAARDVRASLDREALRAAAEDPSAVTFLGVATVFVGVGYDWERLPPFLGTEVWSPARGAYLPADAAERVYERLDLAPVNAVEREIAAEYTDLGGYAMPSSAWRDGPAAGVVFRDKHDRRARRVVAERDVTALAGDVEDLADRAATATRLEAAVERIEARGGTPTVEAVRDRLVERFVREQWARLDERRGGFDGASLERAVGERVARRL